MVVVTAWMDLGLRDQYENIKTIQKIQKLHQNPEQCHHLRVSLETEKVGDLPPVRTMGIMAKRTLELPKACNLVLELSLKKDKKSRGSSEPNYCVQCGQRFSQHEYELYRRMLRKAKTVGFSAWELKGLFQHRKRFSDRKLLEHITEGEQQYVCKISRLVTAGMLSQNDQDALYDDVIKRFQ